MKVLTGLALLIGLAACGPRADRETGTAADTSLTTRQTQDTTIVTSDTTVDVDTVNKEGDKAVTKDTVKH
jgi:ABC-type glycerol-3-phosphate transport system substrate-binding protein